MESLHCFSFPGAVPQALIRSRWFLLTFLARLRPRLVELRGAIHDSRPELGSKRGSFEVVPGFARANKYKSMNTDGLLGIEEMDFWGVCGSMPNVNPDEHQL